VFGGMAARFAVLVKGEREKWESAVMSAGAIAE
jgi:hypothetical protein